MRDSLVFYKKLNGFGIRKGIIIPSFVMIIYSLGVFCASLSLGIYLSNLIYGLKINKILTKLMFFLITIVVVMTIYLYSCSKRIKKVNQNPSYFKEKNEKKIEKLYAEFKLKNPFLTSSGDESRELTLDIKNKIELYRSQRNLVGKYLKLISNYTIIPLTAMFFKSEVSFQMAAFILIFCFILCSIILACIWASFDDFYFDSFLIRNYSILTGAEFIINIIEKTKKQEN